MAETRYQLHRIMHGENGLLFTTPIGMMETEKNQAEGLRDSYIEIDGAEMDFRVLTIIIPEADNG